MSVLDRIEDYYNDNRFKLNKIFDYISTDRHDILLVYTFRKYNSNAIVEVEYRDLHNIGSLEIRIGNVDTNINRTRDNTIITNDIDYAIYNLENIINEVMENVKERMGY